MLFTIFRLFRIRQRIDTEGVVIGGICDGPGILAVCGIVGILDLGGILVLVKVLCIRRVTQCCVIFDDDLAVAVRLDIVFCQLYRKILLAISARHEFIVLILYQIIVGAVLDGQILDRIEGVVQLIADLKDTGIINCCVRGCRLSAFFRCFSRCGSRVGGDFGLNLKGDSVAGCIAVTVLGVDSIALGSSSVSKNDLLVNSGSGALCISHIAIGKRSLGVNGTGIDRARVIGVGVIHRYDHRIVKRVACSLDQDQIGSGFHICGKCILVLIPCHFARFSLCNSILGSCRDLFGGRLFNVSDGIAAHDFIACEAVAVIGSVDDLIVENLRVLFDIIHRYGSRNLIARRRHHFIRIHRRSHCQHHYDGKHNGHDSSDLFHVVLSFLCCLTGLVYSRLFLN